MFNYILSVLTVVVALQVQYVDAITPQKTPEYVTANSQNTKKKELMLQDLDRIHHLFEVKYAPFKWKFSQHTWSMDHELDLAKAAIRKIPNPSIKDFQVVARDYVGSTRDHHVSISFFSTEYASLPFSIHSSEGAEGRYFVSTVLPDVRMPRLQVGDEVLEFDGKPIARAVKDYQQESFKNKMNPSFQRRVERMFTLRLGSLGDRIPKGVVTLTLLHKGDTDPSTYTIEWSYIPELIRGVPKQKNAPFKGHKLAEIPFLMKSATCPYFEAERQLLASGIIGNNPYPAEDETEEDETEEDEREEDEGEEDETEEDYDPKMLQFRDGKLPNLGEPIRDYGKSFPFRAYIYENEEGNKIGVVRIPCYYSLKEGLTPETYKELEENVEAFAKLMGEFEQETDALVIEQLDNPGGYLFYCYALLTTLVDRPLRLPTASEMMTQEEVFHSLIACLKMSGIESDEEAQKFFGGKTLVGYPISKKFVDGFLTYAQFLMKEWDQGKVLSDPYYLTGLKTLQAHKLGHFTKPLLLLINEKSASCGDMFPAILQDNKRATLLGTTTSGAGGSVSGEMFSNRNGIADIHFTDSILYRLNGKPIEDLGVSPDIYCPFTERDLEGDYEDYIETVHQAISELLN